LALLTAQGTVPPDFGAMAGLCDRQPATAANPCLSPAVCRWLSTSGIQRQARILRRNLFLFYYNMLSICADSGTSIAMYQAYPAIGIQRSK